MIRGATNNIFHIDIVMFVRFRRTSAAGHSSHGVDLRSIVTVVVTDAIMVLNTAREHQTHDYRIHNVVLFSFFKDTLIIIDYS